jgi:hypothetical protein
MLKLKVPKEKWRNMHEIYGTGKAKRKHTGIFIKTSAQGND